MQDMMMRNAKMIALKALIGKMRGMEHHKAMEDDKEDPREEAREEMEESMEPDMSDMADKGGHGMDEEENGHPSFEDEKKAYMQRSNRTPVMGKTRTIMMSMAVKPKASGHKKSF